ncbi:hypothetical protein TNCV_2865591 [Trichonephila clavipes]|nr:hypothetical protein TNCV_2865591 [Trichonephila clavipes]
MQSISTYHVPTGYPQCTLDRFNVSMCKELLRFTLYIFCPLSSKAGFSKCDVNKHLLTKHILDALGFVAREVIWTGYPVLEGPIMKQVTVTMLRLQHRLVT